MHNMLITTTTVFPSANNPARTVQAKGAGGQKMYAFESDDMHTEHQTAATLLLRKLGIPAKGLTLVKQCDNVLTWQVAQ